MAIKSSNLTIFKNRSKPQAIPILTKKVVILTFDQNWSFKFVTSMRTLWKAQQNGNSMEPVGLEFALLDKKFTVELRGKNGQNSGVQSKVWRKKSEKNAQKVAAWGLLPNN